MEAVQTAVVTGAGRGLGAAFARRLAHDGFELLLIDKDKDRLLSVADQLRRDGATVQTISADLANNDDVRAVAEVLTTTNNLAVLVNNAGFGLVRRFHSEDLDKVLAMIQVHIVASITFCRAALPGMIERREGSIINVASAGAFTRFPRDASYISSKAYLVAFTECLALDLIDTGVRVQALCPAWMTTEFTQGAELAEVGYKSPIPKWLYTSPESVVGSSLHALAGGPVAYIPNAKARLAIACIGSTAGMWLLSLLRRRGLGQGPMPGD